MEIRIANDEQDSEMIVRDVPFNPNAVVSISLFDNADGQSATMWLNEEQASMLAEFLIATGYVKTSYKKTLGL